MTDKQTMFIAEYLKDFNATQAAIRAGYSVDSARKIGCELLTKPDIRKEIDRYIKSVVNAGKEALEARIVDELMAIAFADVTTNAQIVTRDRTDEHGNVETYQSVVFEDTGEGKNSRAISSMKMSDKGNLELKFYDKQRALELLGKYTAMFTDRIEHSGGVAFTAPDKLDD